MTGLYRRILVAVDGSKASEKAFKKAIEIAKQNEIESFTLVHVLDVQPYSMYDWYNAERSKEYANKLLDEYENQAKLAGLTEVEKVIQFGNPKVTVARTIAPEKKADLIVCGATGISALDRMFIGSVSEHTARYAKCDVLIVRNDD